MSSPSPTRSQAQSAEVDESALPRTLLERLGYEVVVCAEWFDAQESLSVQRTSVWQIDNQICVSNKMSTRGTADLLWHELGHALLYLDVPPLKIERVKNWWPYPKWLKGVDEYTLETYADQAELAARISMGEHEPATVVRDKDRSVPCGFPVYQMHRLTTVLRDIRTRSMY